jgi:serine/threonine-protein kinase
MRIRPIIKTISYTLAVIASGLIAFFLALQIIELKETVTVPLLTGKSISEAIGLLEKKGIFLEIEGEEYNPEIPARHIIRQDIQQGEKIPKGSSIKVVVSLGRAMFKVPYLVGMDIKDVELTLNRTGLKIGRITRVHSYTVEKDRVIAQRPLPGYSEEDKVNLLVSDGLYEISYRCPSFINMTVNEAERLASILGLRLVVKDRGRVIVFQRPEAGSVVKKGDSIEVTLGRGWGLWF